MKALARYAQGVNRRGMQEKPMFDRRNIEREEGKDVATYPGFLRAMLLQR